MTSPLDAHARANLNLPESKSPDDIAMKFTLHERPPDCETCIPTSCSKTMSTEVHDAESEKSSEFLAKDVMMALNAPVKGAKPSLIPRMLSSLCTALNHPALVNGFFKSDPSERKAKRSASLVNAADARSAKAEVRATSTRSDRRVKRVLADNVSINKGKSIAILTRNKKSKQESAQPTTERRPNIQLLKSEPTKKAQEDTNSQSTRGSSVSGAGNGPRDSVLPEFHPTGSCRSLHLTRLPSTGNLAPFGGFKPSVSEPTMSASITVVGDAKNRIISPRHCFPVVNITSENVHPVNGAMRFASVGGLDSHEWKKSDNLIVTASMTNDNMIEKRTDGGNPDPILHRVAGPMSTKNTSAMMMDLTNTRHPNSCLSSIAQVSVETVPSRVTPELEPPNHDASSSRTPVPSSSISQPLPTDVDADRPLPNLETNKSFMSPVSLSAIAESSQCGNDDLACDEEMRAFLEDILASGGKTIPLPPLDDREIESEQFFDPVGSTFLPVPLPSQDEEPH